MALHRSTDRPSSARSLGLGRERMRRRVGWRRGQRRRSFARAAGATACAYRGGSSFNFGVTRRAVVEKVSDRSANEIGSVAPKSRTQVPKSAPHGVRDEREAGQNSGTSLPRAKRRRFVGRRGANRRQRSLSRRHLPSRRRRFSDDVKANGRGSRVIRRTRSRRRKGPHLLWSSVATEGP